MCQVRALCDIGRVRTLVDTWRALTRPSTAPPPRPSRWAWTADAALAAVLTVGVVSYAMYRYGPQPVPGHVPVGAPVPPRPPMVRTEPVDVWQGWHGARLALTTLPLAARRRYPLAVFWIVIGATLLTHPGPDGMAPAYVLASCVIAAHGAAVYSPYQQAAMVSAVIGGALVLSRLAASFAALPAWLKLALFLVPVGLAANAIHTWRQRARSLEAEQEIAARLAVSKERSRIARELHDVVTHNVSVMVVQAGAARMVLPDDPGRAQEVLRAVEDGGRAALTELRHVMGLLAMDGETLDEAELAPQPGLDRLDALAARIRASGVPVELALTGEPTTLPPGVDLTAYRVVQEAVTNTIKHAEGASVSIRVEYAPEALRVEVTDTGGAPAATARTGDGRGLTGLRERLALYDGVLEAGPRLTAGFRVRATVPLVTP